MISLAASTLASRIASLAPNASATAVVIDDPRMTQSPDEGAVRIHAFRLGSGAWHLRLEEYRSFWGDFPGFCEWQTLPSAWDAEGYPSALCAVEATDPAEIPFALARLLDWATDLYEEAGAEEGASEKVAA